MALKLSDSDKKTIVELYQHPEESTATLASRYAVSSSTISRILKQELSPAEYKKIVQQKKGGGSKPQNPKTVSSQSKPTAKLDSPSKVMPTSSSTIPKPKLKTAESSAESETSEASTQSSRKPVPKRGRTRSRSDAKAEPVKMSRNSELETSYEDPQKELQLSFSPPVIASTVEPDGDEDLSPENDESIIIAHSDIDTPPDELVHEIQSELLDNDRFDDDDDLDDDDLDDDDLDDDDDDLDDDDLELSLRSDQMSVLPFSQAKLPRTCYIIIDRSAELITRPLKTFADLGTVPDSEINEPTLPIFDNHRVAKRFANRRTQRIVKVPDAKVLRTTSSYLMDKGITRLLLDGQVYALMDDD